MEPFTEILPGNILLTADRQFLLTVYRFSIATRRFSMGVQGPGGYFYTMYFIIFISVLFLTLLWILLGPVIIYLDTRENKYQVGLPGIIKAAVVPSEEIFHIRGRLFFFPFKFNPFKPKHKKALNKEERERKKRTRPKRKHYKTSGTITLMKNILASFRVRKLDLDLDTDDFMLNAWLVPAFSAVNSEHVQMQVNFEGKASLMLHVQTRLGALAWALIRTKYQSLFNY